MGAGKTVHFPPDLYHFLHHLIFLMCPMPEKYSDLSSPLSEEELEAIAICESHLGYSFNNKRYLFEAITHASVANTRLKSYERLEFLGDSILGFIVCEFLFETYRDWLEGDLTKVKSNVVSRQSCADLGASLKIDEWLVVGKGVGSKGKVPRSLLANAFESIVAAIYLDGGMDSAKGFLLPLVASQVKEAVSGGLEVNYKSDLQQYAQKRFGLPPNYSLLDDRGPDHDKWFKVAAKIDKRAFEPAWGQNKKEAEQRAAANALASITGQDLPFECDESAK
ncbi:MAG: ribonuclease-3 [Mariniblastus sp.]